MKSFVIVLEWTTRESFLEIIQAAQHFLRSRTPRKRTRVAFVMLDPPGPIFQLLEEIRSTGLADYFKVIHRADRTLFAKLQQESRVWIREGRVEREEILQDICGLGNVFIHYCGKVTGGDVRGSWYFAIQEGHPEDRKNLLTGLLNDLFEDPDAIRFLARKAKRHHNAYCNQITREHLLQAMQPVMRLASRVSA